MWRIPTNCLRVKKVIVVLLLVVKLIGVFVYICLVCVPTNNKKKVVSKDTPLLTINTTFYNNLILILRQSNLICL